MNTNTNTNKHWTWTTPNGTASVQELTMYRPTRVVVRTRSRMTGSGECQEVEHLFALRGDSFFLEQCFVESTPEDVDVHPEAVEAACDAVAEATQRRVVVL